GGVSSYRNFTADEVLYPPLAARGTATPSSHQPVPLLPSVHRPPPGTSRI
ncbi:MAG: hypothetical protein AVDCRST_MAG80-1697, partial [uncultured Rubrobacteraceae bacterium]